MDETTGHSTRKHGIISNQDQPATEANRIITEERGHNYLARGKGDDRQL